MNSSFAEVIKLKNGKTIEADIIKKSNGRIEVDVSGMSVTYYIDEIETIDNKPVVPGKDVAPVVKKVDAPKLTIEIRKEAYYLEPQIEEAIKAGISIIYETYQKEFGF